MKKIKKGDDVIILTGKNKGMHGKVLRMVKDGTRVLVEGVQMVKRHTKPNPNANKQGGIVERESAVHISNVALYNPVTRKADRVKIKILENNKKIRCFKSNDEQVDLL
jgi:large subunit ribosomal protein L24